MDIASSVFWAAFGGGAAAGIFTLVAVIVAEWIRWFMDRPLVKVNVGFGYVHNHPLFDENKLYMSGSQKSAQQNSDTIDVWLVL